MPLQYYAAITILLLGMAGGCSSQQPSPPEFIAQSDKDTGSHPAVAVAKRMIGIPYRYGGNSPQRGFDCSGLVQYAFKEAGINAPRTTKTLYQSTFSVDPVALHEGDLLFFRIEGKVSHVGLYIGGNKFIHAPSSGKKVRYASLDNPYWRKRLIKAGRLF